MADTFHPKKPEQRFAVQLNGKEAHLIKLLRTVSFGEIIVFKADNTIVRCQLGQSILVSEEGGRELIEKQV